MKQNILIIMFTLLISPSASAKNIEKAPFKPRFSIGLNAILEQGTNIGTYTGEYKALSPKINLSPGISFEAQLSKHSGIETGVYYRLLNFPGYTATGSTLGESWRENFLVLPIYYKFYSRIINFTAGVNLGFNLDYDKNHIAQSVKNDVAFMVSISKDITLYKRLYIEPVIQGGLGNRAWWGVGVGLKYRF